MLGELLGGLLAGTVSGVVPGIHVNTLGALLRKAGVSSNLLLFTMGITHTFLDVIPSTFLGVPDEGTSLSILPAHRLALKGRAMEVVKIALWASFLSVVFAVALAPIYTGVAPLYRPEAGRAVVAILFILLVFTERGARMLYSLFIFLLAGLLGMYTFRLPLSEPYYHVFTGLFGMPVLLAAIFQGTGGIEPVDSRMCIRPLRLVMFSFIGTVLGMVASLVPSFTSSQAAIIGSFFSKDERSFLTVVFSVNTSNFLFSFMNYVETGRIRNGIVAIMSPVSRNGLGIYFLAAIFAALSILIYGDVLAELLLGTLTRIPYRLLNVTVVLFLVILSILFDGSLGLLVLFAGTLIGSLASLLNVRRTNCMGVLMLPIILGE